ncbi:MAG: hypothetical protein GKS06_02400 [Acidobacteria bacterium]|nr:hypothetical protein [Acidobacteriota bacterium]
MDRQWKRLVELLDRARKELGDPAFNAIRAALGQAVLRKAARSSRELFAVVWDILVDLQGPPE